MKDLVIYFQPEWYGDDGTNIEYGDIPDELHSWEVFHTIESCKAWLEDHDYDPIDFVIIQYSDDDIEDYEFVD